MEVARKDHTQQHEKEIAMAAARKECVFFMNRAWCMSIPSPTFLSSSAEEEQSSPLAVPFTSRVEQVMPLGDLLVDLLYQEIIQMLFNRVSDRYVPQLQYNFHENIYNFLYTIHIKSC